MNSLNRLEFYNFYQRYKWTPADFEAFEELMKFMVQQTNQWAAPAVLKGLNFSSASTWDITVAAGLAVNPNGLPLNTTTTQEVTTTPGDVSNSRWNLIVARMQETDINDIPEPLNPLNPVPLNTLVQIQIVSISGVLGAGAYPSKEDGDVILFGVKIPAGASSVLSSYVDYTVAEYPFKSSDIQMGMRMFDAVVGTSKFCTHADLNAVMADANIANIKDILVADSATINTTQTIGQANKRIVFKSGVTYTKGTATKAISVTAAGVIIENGRFSGFGSGGNAPIEFTANGNYGVVNMCRLVSSNDITDDSTYGISQVAVVKEV